MGAKRALSDRFWSHVDHSWDGCWEWTGGKNGDGYGVIRGDERRILLAHRLSFVMHKEDLEAREVVMHSCDNPGCVNPDHLFKGSQGQNNKDAWDKGHRSLPLKDAKGLFRSRIEPMSD